LKLIIPINSPKTLQALVYLNSYCRFY